jgi:hypothetical protein
VEESTHDGVGAGVGHSSGSNKSASYWHVLGSDTDICGVSISDEYEIFTVALLATPLLQTSPFTNVFDPYETLLEDDPTYLCLIKGSAQFFCDKS